MCVGSHKLILVAHSVQFLKNLEVKGNNTQKNSAANDPIISTIIPMNYQLHRPHALVPTGYRKMQIIENKITTIASAMITAQILVIGGVSKINEGTYPQVGQGLGLVSIGAKLIEGLSILQYV